MQSAILILRQVAHESAGTVEDSLRQAGLSFEYLDLFEDYPRELPLDELAGLVVLGGPMNVDEVDAHPFLSLELDWVRGALDRQLPLLGLCLGSQLLAKACGARVYPNPVKEIGWYPLELTAEGLRDRLFEDCGHRLTVFQWHGDTFDLPADAAHLAASPQCPNQAIRVGRAAYGLQFHLEMTAAMIEDWLVKAEQDGELASLPYISPAEIRGRTASNLPVLQALSERIIGRFAALSRERLATLRQPVAAAY